MVLVVGNKNLSTISKSKKSAKFKSQVWQKAKD